MKYILAMVLFIFGVQMISCSKKPELKDGLYARIETDKGDIYVQLEYEKAKVDYAKSFDAYEEIVGALCL